MEIIRLSDKTFKETAKDVELSSVFRSTNKGGYLSLDPSKRLPHENEKRKFSGSGSDSTSSNDTIFVRKIEKTIDDFGEQNLSLNASINGVFMGGDNEKHQYQLQKLNEYSRKLLSQSQQQSDETILFNKNQFREILMNVLNITDLDSNLPDDILNHLSSDDNNDTIVTESNQVQLTNDENKVEVSDGEQQLVSETRDKKIDDTTATNIQSVENTDDQQHSINDAVGKLKQVTVYKENPIQISYPNESIDKLKVPDNFHLSTTSTIQQDDSPEVDKILTGGEIFSIF